MKRLILRPALLLAALFAFSPLLKAQDLNSAILLTRSEQYDQAAEAFQELIKKEPANGKNYFYMGENILADYYSDTISNSLAAAAKEAEQVYQKGVEASPGEPLNYVGLAKVAFLQGDNNTADQMRSKARSFLMPYKKVNKKMSPPAPEYSFILAKVAESYINPIEGEVDTAKALPLIREALRIDNTNRDVYLIAGDIYILKNDGSKAIAFYNQAEFADPQSPTAAMKIGNIYVAGRAYTAAVPYFEKAIELNANFAPAYRELGQLYLNSGVYDKARQYFEKYLELTAGNIPAKIRYVNALFYGKDYEGVIKNVEEIFKVDKSRAYMNRIAGYSAYEKNPPDYDQALAYMEALFETVAPERILQKDYIYLARILVRKNSDYGKLNDQLNSLKQRLDKEQGRFSTASAAEKPKIKAGMADISNQIAEIEKELDTRDAEVDKAFQAYNKALSFKPEPDRNLLNEMGNQYYVFKRYNEAAKTWTRLLDPSKENLDELMRIGRAYYTGENFKAADSLFTEITRKNPDYVPAYLMIANTYVKMDPDSKQGLARPKFQKVLEVAAKDSVANAAAMMDALTYLSHYNMVNDNLDMAQRYYQRMVNLSDNKDYKIRGYYGLGSVELNATRHEKTNEGRLPYLTRAQESYNKILALDPNNNAAKSQLNYIREFQAQIKKGINPNEIRGVVRNTAGQPIPYASVRVKDTAAENLTNAQGTYRFEIPSGSETLIVSAKGYKSVEIPITKQRVYDVTLEQ